MLHNIKNVRGFTLVELLVAVAIVGIISIISVQSLYDAVSIRSKQYSIEDTSDNFRSMIKLITKEVMGGKNISIINSGEIKIKGDVSCVTITYVSGSGSVLYSRSTDTLCIPPTLNISGRNIQISDFSLSPVSDLPRVVSLYIKGVYKNSLGDHPFEYQTTITPRVSI